MITKKGEETRDRIFEAATQVVARKGIENASVTAICKLAKVSRGLLPYYLPRKKDLLVELVKYILRTGWTRFEGMPVPRLHSRVPREIEDRIRRNFAFFSKNSHYFQVFMLFFYRASYDRVCRRLNTEIYNTVVESFARSLSEGKPRASKADSAAAARIYGRMFFEIQRIHITESRPPLDPEAILEELLAEIAESFRPRSS